MEQSIMIRKYDPKTKVNWNIKYPDLSKTRERLRSLTSGSESLRSLESLSLGLKETHDQTFSLLISFGSLMSDLGKVSDRLERKTRDSEDSEVWTETEDLINVIDKETADLRESLTVFSKWIRDPETDRLLSLLFSETADHFIMDLLLVRETD